MEKYDHLRLPAENLIALMMMMVPVFVMEDISGRLLVRMSCMCIYTNV